MTRSTWLAWMTLLLALAAVTATARAAEIYRCTEPNGRVAFSDRPCPEGQGAAKVILEGQPKIAEDGPAPASEPTEPAPEPAEPEAPPAPPVKDARGDQLRRLNFLLGQLVNGVAQAGTDCATASTTMQAWLQRSGGEAASLWPAWESVQDGEAPPPGEELAALGELIRKQMREFENETLTRLTARCWESKALGDSVDAVRAQFPDR